jgi:predicted acyl esterase
MRGGRPGFSFNGFIINGFYGTNKVKDLRKNTLLPRHQYDDAFWAHLRPDISKINVPMYVVASYSTGLHSVGSVHIFRDAPVQEKWLRFHDAQEWYDIADNGNLDDLQAFYDAYALVGDEGTKARSKWESQTPRVRNCILPFGEGKRGLIVASDTYPPPAKDTLELFLDSDATLKESIDKVTCQEGTACYNSSQYRASTHFDWKCNRRMVLSGMPKVVLHVSPKEHSTSGDEMDIVILVRKLDKNGQPMVHLVIPLESMQKVASETNVEGPKSEKDIDNVQTMKQYGAHGIMRLSHRSIAKDENGKNVELIPGYPHHSHTQSDVEAAKAAQTKSFQKGAPVAFETGLWPIGMLLEEGEGLRLEIGGNILWAPEFEMLRRLQIEENENRGMHQIHYGSGVMNANDGLGLSRLILPVADLKV